MTEKTFDNQIWILCVEISTVTIDISHLQDLLVVFFSVYSN